MNLCVDDSLFVENDEFLASFMADTRGGENTSGESSSDGATTTSRPVQTKKLNKPMLSKDDKRRTYAKMFSEAFNSGDMKQLSNFVQNYCTAESVMIQKCVVAANSYIPKYVEVFGSSAILEFWANTFLTVPDCLMVMLETKLRIRNRQFQPQQDASGGGFSGKGIVDEIQNEGSSIVCSFSFTGTKIYTTKMEGAVTQPPGIISDGNGHGNNNSQVTSISLSESTASILSIDQSQSQPLSLQGIFAAGVPPPKPAKHSKKRSFAVISDSASGTSNPSAGLPESSIDKFNIFLHPPRKYSTLAGTPFGGSPHYYTKNQHNSNQSNQISQATKMSDYISINANTKFSTGSFMEQEGYINFLGTLTMTLDSDNKINKFEFIYSHMD
jgi:hypothetical protein